MLPVSGAEQLNTSEAQPMWPISSASGAYSRLLNPAPRNSSSSCVEGGMNMFHKPSALTIRHVEVHWRSLTFLGENCGRHCLSAVPCPQDYSWPADISGCDKG